ncbi:hypothetical protein GQ53DRAFT_844965 [Thozetella sp. PMI_491]|nr:hypothetical protein GQ53DRAFT_844965 [Thozetella sp. PMI_491]
MAAIFSPLVILAAIAAAAVPREGLHLATLGLLQIRPAFVGKGIILYPGHSFGHDPTDHVHLTPGSTKELYYCQEGHRPAFHGSKHASLTAVFNLPTVVLDHSTHPLSVDCSADDKITVCFQQPQFDHVQNAWNIPEFYVITFHVGCGDEYTGRRSYFHATNPRFNPTGRCVTVDARSIEQEDAIQSGEILFGTFRHPEYKTRVPVKGHIRLNVPDPYPQVQEGKQLQRGFARDSTSNNRRDSQDPEPSENNVLKPLPENSESDTNTENILDPKKLSQFADEENIQLGPAVPSDIKLAGGLEDRGVVKGHEGPQRDELLAASTSHGIERRFWFLRSIFRAITSLVKENEQSVAKAIATITTVIGKVAYIIANVAVIYVKVWLVAFGVPFDHSYHDDFKFDFYLQSRSTPPILGYENGFSIFTQRDLKNGEPEISLQCSKCGISADFSIEGHLAFSLKSGLTKGSISFTNNDPFTIDVIFGLKVAEGFDEPVKGIKKQLGAYPLSPLTIPGVFTLGPEITISAALDLAIQGGKESVAEMIVGGSLSISKGVASLDAVNRENNRVTGLAAKFTPVAKFHGSISSTVELGLPVALECGVNILNGKFKRTIGLVNNPAVYLKAKVANEEQARCKKGIEFLVGVKNRIYVEAFGSWDYPIRDDELYEKSLGCVTPGGISGDSKPEDRSVINEVVKKLGIDIIAIKPNISDLASQPSKLDERFGYRIIMSADEEGILVVGNDGGIYLTPTDQKYDMSAPIGSTNLSSNLLDIDVLSRVLAYEPDTVNGRVAKLTFYNATKMPEIAKAAFLSVVNQTAENDKVKVDKAQNQAKKDALNYGLVLKQAQGKVYFPTFCKYLDRGYRLFGTTYAFNGNYGFKDMNGNPPRRREFNFIDRGLNDFRIVNGGGHNICVTVKLTSKITGNRAEPGGGP